MRGLFVSSLWLACSMIAGCNEADFVAHPVVSGSAQVDPHQDAAALSCDYAAQLARHSLPAGLANVFVNCEWPLRADDAHDDLTWLVGQMSQDAGSAAMRCATDPYFWWQEPQHPLLPRKFVYCSGACAAVKDWVTCKLRDDPCSSESDAAVSEEDAGPHRCGP
jgi:hypothetical protein